MGFTSATTVRRMEKPEVMSPAEASVSPETGMVHRVSAILGAFRASDLGVPVAELARRSGLPRSTTHRLVDQLLEVGLLERDGSRVRLGLRMFELGQLVPQQRTVRSAATPFLHDLRDATHRTVNLAVLDGADMIYLDRVPWGVGPSLPFRPGGRHPAHATAMGKAIMAHVSDEQLDLICRDGFEALTPQTVTTRDELEAQFEEIRADGLSYDRGETRPDVHCVASPIFDGEGRVLGAISVSGMASPTDVSRCGPAVRIAALNLTRTLRRTMVRAV